MRCLWRQLAADDTEHAHLETLCTVCTPSWRIVCKRVLVLLYVYIRANKTIAAVTPPSLSAPVLGICGSIWNHLAHLAGPFTVTLLNLRSKKGATIQQDARFLTDHSSCFNAANVQLTAELNCQLLLPLRFASSSRTMLAAILGMPPLIRSACGIHIYKTLHIHIHILIPRCTVSYISLV